MKKKLTVVIAAVIMLSAWALSAQPSKPLCDGFYRYEISKDIPHPGVPAEATLCVQFPLRQVLGDAYDKHHFEKALRDGGFTFKVTP